MSRESIAEVVAGRLFATEAAIDAALVEAGSLVALLPAARAEAYLSAVSGQRAFDGVAGAVSALTEARAQVVAAHGVLSAVARRMGLNDTAVGPMDKPDDGPPIGGGPNDPQGGKVNKSLLDSSNAC